MCLSRRGSAVSPGAAGSTARPAPAHPSRRAGYRLRTADRPQSALAFLQSLVYVGSAVDSALWFYFVISARPVRPKRGSPSPAPPPAISPRFRLAVPVAAMPTYDESLARRGRIPRFFE
ncbi:MAG: hypothetical protein BroJett031_01650 [Betaproteobacteria bacterium]|nr:MAG: hypothetical protein BroJett031_01650 [Betaproteobacteria bacterium]